MLEDIRSNFERLIALYENERQRADRLQAELQIRDAEMESCRKHIADLERQVDNLKLKWAFLGGNDSEAKERIDRMIAAIDKCISLMEN